MWNNALKKYEKNVTDSSLYLIATFSCFVDMWRVTIFRSRKSFFFTVTVPVVGGSGGGGGGVGV